MRNRQQGVTTIGFILMAAVAVLILFGGLRIFPMYMENMKIVKILEDVSSQQQGSKTSVAKIRTAIGKRLNIEAVSTLKTKDFIVKKTRTGYTIRAQYDASAPYFGNLYLVAKFDDLVEVKN